MIWNGNGLIKLLRSSELAIFSEQSMMRSSVEVRAMYVHPCLGSFLFLNREICLEEI